MYRRPAEWERRALTVFAWPSDKRLWAQNLEPAQVEFCALLNALKDEKICVLVKSSAEAEELARRVPKASTKIMPYGDIWLRDTLGIQVKSSAEARFIVPQFNGWGNKYLFQNDKDLAERFAHDLKTPITKIPIVCEAGALESNGRGTVLTTKSCLLNKNRNPHMSPKDIEKILCSSLGAENIMWLNDGLLNDHTDGHIDNLARFIKEDLVVIMSAKNKADPNYMILEQIRRELDYSKKLNILEIPSPGAIYDDQNKLMPASYLNFIITNTSLIMPIYHSQYDHEAMEILAKNISVPLIALPAKAILSGGGAFHCISQEIFS
jgi:agmatine deiminase